MKPQIKNKTKTAHISTVCTASPLESSNQFPNADFCTAPPPEDVSLLKQQRLDQVFPTPGANAGQILAPRTGRWAFLLVSAQRNGASSRRGISFYSEKIRGEEKR
jgi:hypothetical protein